MGLIGAMMTCPTTKNETEARMLQWWQTKLH